MAVDSVSHGGAAHPSQSSRSRVDRQREERSVPNLHAAVVANTQSLMSALGPSAAETKRLNNLISSAKAAAVQLVTQPVETAPTEKVKSVDELLDGVRFSRRAYSDSSEASAEPTTKRVTPSVTPPTAPVASGPITTPPVVTAPVDPQPSAPPAPPVVVAPPTAPEPTPVTTPVSTTPPSTPSEPAPATPTPPVATTPAAPTTPPATTPPPSTGLGGLLGGLFGRR